MLKLCGGEFLSEEEEMEKHKNLLIGIMKQKRESKIGGFLVNFQRGS